MEENALHARDLSGSYSIDDLDGRVELTRLEMQASAALDLELAQLRRLNIPSDATIVDVGCGPGFMSARLAALASEGRVVGVDADAALIDRARKGASVAGRANARFLTSWADDMPIQDDYADFAYARFLLQHTPKPVEIVREMARVCRPGGRVCVVDTDDGNIIVHPSPRGLARLLMASYEGQGRLGGDRFIGRKLPAIFAEAGLTDVEVVPVPFTSGMVGMDCFVDICLGYKRQILAEDRMTPAEADAVIASLRALRDTPGAWAQTMAYFVIGTVSTDG